MPDSKEKAIELAWEILNLQKDILFNAAAPATVEELTEQEDRLQILDSQLEECWDRILDRSD